MNFKIQDAPPEHWDWLTEKLGLYITPAFKAVEAVDSQGRIRGMVGYDKWTPNSVQMHTAVESPQAWLSLLGPGLQYPFEQAYGRGVEILHAAVNDDNLPCKKFLFRLGWTMVHRVRGGFTPAVDVLLFEMRKEQWQSMRYGVRALKGRV